MIITMDPWAPRRMSNSSCKGIDGYRFELKVIHIIMQITRPLPGFGDLMITNDLGMIAKMDADPDTRGQNPVWL